MKYGWQSTVSLLAVKSIHYLATKVADYGIVEVSQ